MKIGAIIGCSKTSKDPKMCQLPPNPPVTLGTIINGLRLLMIVRPQNSIFSKNGPQQKCLDETLVTKEFFQGRMTILRVVQILYFFPKNISKYSMFCLIRRWVIFGGLYSEVGLYLKFRALIFGYLRRFTVFVHSVCFGVFGVFQN